MRSGGLHTLLWLPRALKERKKRNGHRTEEGIEPDPPASADGTGPDTAKDEDTGGSHEG